MLSGIAARPAGCVSAPENRWGPLRARPRKRSTALV